MNIRTALKICKEHFGDRPWETLTLRKRRYRQVQKAIRIGRRKQMGDDRFPFIPSEEELEEQGMIMTSIFAGAAVEMFKSRGMEPPAELLEYAMDFSGLTEEEAIEKDRKAFLIEGGLNESFGTLALPEEDFENET